MAAVRRLGQFHADLCAAEFRKRVVSRSTLHSGLNSNRHRARLFDEKSDVTAIPNSVSGRSFLFHDFLPLSDSICAAAQPTRVKRNRAEKLSSLSREPWIMTPLARSGRCPLEPPGH